MLKKRCLYQVICEVRKTHIDNGSGGAKDLFENMYVRMTASSLQRSGDEVKDVYKALKSLRKKEFEIETDNEWVLTSWILEAWHDKKSNMYEVLIGKNSKKLFKKILFLMLSLWGVLPSIFFLLSAQLSRIKIVDICLVA